MNGLPLSETQSWDKAVREIQHGSASTYVNHDWRCDSCRDAWRVYAPRKQANDRYRRSEKGKARDVRARTKRR